MLYSPPPSDGGGGERCEPVGALTADVPFSRWRCADRSRRPFHHASHGPPPPLRQGRLRFAHSVPLLGCGFEIMLMRKSAQIRLKFPSPCGDVVLKFSDSWNEYAKALAGFPSPCGDVVLKWLERRFLSASARRVSVPLRGCGFEMLHDMTGDNGLTVHVSVPLRGCGFEIDAGCHIVKVHVIEFPSPCGDVVLKFSDAQREVTTWQVVSVPLRGCGFEIVWEYVCTEGEVFVSVPLRGCGFEI